MPPLLILIMTNDEKARVECLNSTYELGNVFERLSRVQGNTARTEKDDHDCLINIKNILQKISVQKTALIFSYYPMDKQVEESLSRIRRMDTTDENPVTVFLMQVNLKGPGTKEWRAELPSM